LLEYHHHIGLVHILRALFPKEAPEVPEGSNLFLNVLREASPLAAFRRKRTSFGKLHLLRLSEGSARGSRRKQLVSVLRLPSASFGKLHLWRGGGFLRKASPLAGWRLSEGSRRKRTCFEKSASFGLMNVLREASPLAAFRRKRTCFEKSASFGFLRKASPLAAFRRKRTCFRPSAF